MRFEGSSQPFCGDSKESTPTAAGVWIDFAVSLGTSKASLSAYHDTLYAGQIPLCPDQTLVPSHSPVFSSKLGARSMSALTAKFPESWPSLSDKYVEHE